MKNGTFTLAVLLAATGAAAHESITDYDLIQEEKISIDAQCDPARDEFYGDHYDGPDDPKIEEIPFNCNFELVLFPYPAINATCNYAGGDSDPDDFYRTSNSPDPATLGQSIGDFFISDPYSERRLEKLSFTCELRLRTPVAPCEIC